MTDNDVLEEEVLIFDVDKKTYIKDLDLPAVPEPAATVLLESFYSLLEKREAFVATTGTSREKIVLNEGINRNRLRITGHTQH